MKKLLLTLFIIFTTSYCFAYTPDTWTTQDTVLQSTFVILTAIDLWQTYTFLYTENYREEGYGETNPFLGRYPSKQLFFTYSSICFIGHFLISYLLPKNLRSIWQLSWSCIELKTINDNYNLGVRIKF